MAKNVAAGTARIGRHSLRWRLPALIAALLIVIVATFLGLAYREYQDAHVELTLAALKPIGS